MLLKRSNLIYLHAPKTGGNSIQTALLPYSEDSKVVLTRQDGVDRFEVRGPHTPEKHARLEDYARSIPDIARYKVAISVRHPFERAVSFYFTPLRWMRQEGAQWRVVEPVWSRNDFVRFLGSVAPLVSFLTVQGKIKRPDFIIRYETIERDFAALTDALGLADIHLPHVNRSAAPPELVRSVLADDELRDFVCQRYAADMDAFGYARRA